MPREVWGYKLGDHVEIREWFDGRWEAGVVLGFSSERTLLVRPEGGPVREVKLPKHVRPWRKPQTTEEIERYLDG